MYIQVKTERREKEGVEARKKERKKKKEKDARKPNSMFQKLN